MLAKIIERLPTLPRLQSLQKFCVDFLQKPKNLKKFLRYQNPEQTKQELNERLKYLLSGSPQSEHDLNKLFSASYNWIIHFLDEHGIRLYAPLSPANRISEKYANLFIEQVSDAMNKFGRRLVLNLDETSVKISMFPKKALNFTDPEKRIRTFFPNLKACFTAVGIIGADGTRYEPLIIARGETSKCGKVIDELLSEGLPIHGKLFSKSGWMNGIAMLDVLDYVAEIRDGINRNAKIALVLDVFRAHLSKEVKKKAKLLKIELIPVPANGTGIYQPLDVVIFGILKQYLRQSFRDWLETLNPASDLSIAVKEGIRRFVESWERITEENIISAWNEIPQLIERYESKKRDSDNIYADINQIDENLQDFIDSNVIQLSNIVKKESDTLKSDGLVHFSLF